MPLFGPRCEAQIPSEYVSLAAGTTGWAFIFFAVFAGEAGKPTSARVPLNPSAVKPDISVGTLYRRLVSTVLMPSFGFRCGAQILNEYVGLAVGVTNFASA